MSWIISDYHNILLILCGVFYSVLCIFSIVTGLMYAQGKRELNPLELSERFVSNSGRSIVGQFESVIFLKG